MTGFSVVITHYRRLENLRRTLQGLSEQTLLPNEVIVVDMERGIEGLNDYPFKLRVETLDEEWSYMPLAESRNYGAKLSEYGTLVFLDVDCIPSDEFCEKMVMACTENRGLVMGTPRYMVVNGISTGPGKFLRERSVPHPMRPIVSGTRREECYEMFWSLCFAIPKHGFLQIGGFDEGYQGYGVEDTDFALETRSAGIPFFLCEAEVFHQQHSVYVPPLNNLEPIVRNCNRFYLKWGFWPMEDCLMDFDSLGYIDWDSDMHGLIEVKYLPSTEEVGARLVKNAPYR